MSLYQQWLAAKDRERLAVEERRAIEDQLTRQFGISETEEGVKRVKEGQFEVKIQCRMSRKVDADLIQEIAAENGLGEYLSTLVRWKPELNLTAWKAADPRVTDLLSKAVTTTPGRPSYQIEIKE